MTAQLRLQRHQRVRSSSDFERIYAARTTARAPGLLVFGLRNGLAHTRFGLSVSRKNGGAVVRNRLKRLLREAFRLEQHALPAGLDLILIPQPGPEPSLAGYRAALIQAVTAVSRKAKPLATDSGTHGTGEPGSAGPN